MFIVTKTSWRLEGVASPWQLTVTILILSDNGIIVPLYKVIQTLENEKCKTPAYIYGSKKLLYCRQCREITDPAHFFLKYSK